MKISLIFPRVKSQVHGMWPPLGIIGLGTLLKGLGHQVRCHDLSFDPGPERMIEILKKERPDLVGLSCLTDFMPIAGHLVRAAKELGAATVMGGPHPTIAPEPTLAAIPELDYALVGEAEKSLPALVSALDAGKVSGPIPGLYLRDGGGVRLSAPAEIIEDLDWIPVPDRELLDVNREYLRARAVNMHASRGCPFHCRFCQPTLERMFGKKVRFMGPERVAAEIEFYHQKYGFHDFFFHDDTFTIKKSWLSGLVEALGRKDLIKGFRYVVNSRVDTFDEDRAALLKEMGVYYVLFGIESGSQAVLDAIAKGTTLKEARESFRICRKFKFRTHAYVLLGAPSETRESLKATEDFVAELRPNTVHLSIYTPLLGTHLADECEQKGLIAAHDYADHDYYLKRTLSGEGPIRLPGLSYQDLLDARRRILKRRKSFVFRDNLRELARDLAREPSLDKFVFRWQFYRRMQHYFG